MYAEDSINLLRRSGIDFDAHLEHGIEPTQFAELLISSGLILNEKVCWISFHSVFDYVYLLRLLLNRQLPENENEFDEFFRLFFPRSFDIKHIVVLHKNRKGG